MFNKDKNKTLSGTVEETRMILSPKGTPLFEIYHNDTKSIINIACYTDKETSFRIESVQNDSKEYVSSDNPIYFYTIIEHVC